MKHKLIVSIIIIYMLILFLIPNASLAEGTMIYSYTSSGKLNIWGEGVQSTFADYGYGIYLKVNGTETEASNGRATLNGVSLETNPVYVSDRNYVRIVYKVTNNSSSTKTIGVASCADIQIGSNDYAPISNLSGNRGFTMSGDGHSFNFLGRSTYGVVDVDTYWFGQYQVNRERKWNMSTTYDYAGQSSRRGDSGMAYSWQNRKLEPGETIELSVLIGIGDINEPPKITLDELSETTYTIKDKIEVNGTVTDPDINDVVGVRYAFDNGTEYNIQTEMQPHGVYVPYSGQCPIPSDLTEGTHKLQVWAYDNHGNLSKVMEKEFILIIDITPPEATHTLEPNIWTRDDVTIKIKATDDITGVKSITAPNGEIENGDTIEYVVNENGNYEFILEDNAKNKATYNVEVSNIDKVNPYLTLSNPSKKWTSDKIEINFQARDEESGIDRIVLPDKSIIRADNGKYYIETNGTYKFTVYDKAGNFKTQKLTIGNIDKVNPKIELSANRDWVADKVEIEWKVEDLESGISKIKLPNNNENGNSIGKYTVSENGTYYFTVIDNVGHEVTESITITNIDKTAPNLILDYKEDWQSEILDITWKIQDNESGIKEVYLPDNTTSNENTGIFHVNQNGIYKFMVYDNVGNITVKEITISNIDSDGPIIILSADKSWKPDKVGISWKIIDSKSGLREVILPNGEKVNQKNGVYNASENGKYTFVAYDMFGNMSSAEETINNIDKTEPEIELDISNTEWTNENVLIKWKATDTQSGVREIIIPDGTKDEMNNASYTVTKNGEYIIIAYDNVGNENVKTIKIDNIDKIKPRIKIEKQMHGDKVVIAYEVEDSESGIKEIILPNNEKLSNQTKGTYEAIGKGNYKFIVYDKAGNYEIETITID